MDLVEQIVGMRCSRKAVGRMRSLSLGFGNEARRATGLNGIVCREWEMGIYRSAWRIVGGGTVLCGSQDVADSIEDLNIALGTIDLGRFASLRQISDLDVRIEFDTGIAVEFLAAASDDDESFHIFCPGQRFIEFTPQRG